MTEVTHEDHNTLRERTRLIEGRTSISETSIAATHTAHANLQDQFNKLRAELIQLVARVQDLEASVIHLSREDD